MTAPQVGDVIPYFYLWRREHDEGEESGRKPRPCVVVVAVRPSSTGALLVVVAAVTTQEPDASDVAIEIPGALKRALKLDAARSWVICNEVNQFTWPGFDLDVTPEGERSYGKVPGSLLQRIRRAIVASHAKSTNRDE